MPDPTAWLVRDKTIGGSAPRWEDADSTYYENHIDHIWEWTSSWEIFAKSTSDTGVIWSAVSYTWEDDPTTLTLNPWTVFTNTRIQSDTTWSVNTNTQVRAATET